MRGENINIVVSAPFLAQCLAPAAAKTMLWRNHGSGHMLAFFFIQSSYDIARLPWWWMSQAFMLIAPTGRAGRDSLLRRAGGSRLFVAQGGRVATLCCSHRLEHAEFKTVGQMNTSTQDHFVARAYAWF